MAVAEKTSPTRSTRTPPPPSALAQDGTTPRSPAFSTTSTADDGESSPVLPPLQAPRLPDRVQEFLRTPSPNHEERDDSSQYRTASWGSPYPPADRNLRSPSALSDQSDDSPIHQLDIGPTPFLRPAPFARLQPGQGPTSAFSASSSFSAAVLANRARRPAQGLTEDWLRQHTNVVLGSESQAWLSDEEEEDAHHQDIDAPCDEGETPYENYEDDLDELREESSLLSGSSLDVNWLDPDFDHSTPRANPNRPHQRPAPNHQPSHTLTQANLAQLALMSRMTAEEIRDHDSAVFDTMSEGTAQSTSDVMAPAADKPRTSGSPDYENGNAVMPSTPVRLRRGKNLSSTPRLKKKIPWKGKNIMVLLPRDDDRGQEGQAPRPLTRTEIRKKIAGFDQEGYNTRPFNLAPFITDASQSRDSWPNPEEVNSDRARRQYQVTLPDLNRWKDYVEELQEAKLRALGVTFAAEEPAETAQPSPVISQPSRVASAQYPPLPFSPPLPTGSAASNNPFAFNPQLMSGAVSTAGQSPNLMSSVSPMSFSQPITGNVHKHRPGQSIAIPSADFPSQFQQSPHGWGPQQALLQQLSRNGSPSLVGFGALASPGSPFQNEGFPPPPAAMSGGHNRTQSLQYPMLPHQQQRMSARATPRLQELHEDDEDEAMHLNNDLLQREIDEAEYHLEEQFKAQLEEDEYSPHREPGKNVADLEHVNSALNSHLRQQSVHFLEPTPPNHAHANDVVLHHPAPHSRGHSVSQKFFDHDDPGVSTDDASAKPQPIPTVPFDQPQQTDQFAYEVDTNPSDMGTPVDNFPFGRLGHQQGTFSNASNPWEDVASGNEHSRRASHASKPSLSKLNVDAPEFKFNPSASSAAFNPAQGTFTFGNISTFKASAPEFTPSAPASHTAGHLSDNSLSSVSKINANAPAFSPGKSEFSFSSLGPKFRPDAPAFTPGFSGSIGSPRSGNESSTSANPIFSDLDVASLDIVKPVKKNKAIPIIKPESPSKERSYVQDSEGRFDNALQKRVRQARADDADDEPKFSPSPAPEHEVPTPEVDTEAVVEEAEESAPTPVSPVSPVEKHGDDDLTVPADLTTLSSTIMSESADSKAATSPEATSPEQPSFSWRPFELRSEEEMLAFDQGRPFGEEVGLEEPKEQAKEEQEVVHVPDVQIKTLSPTAMSFTPGVMSFNAPSEALPKDMEESSEATPAETATEVASPAPPSAPSGLAASRFAPKPKGLAASRFAIAPQTPPPPPVEESPEPQSEPQAQFVPEPEEEPAEVPSGPPKEDSGIPSFDEIDAVMQAIDAHPSKGVKRSTDLDAHLRRTQYSGPVLAPANLLGAQEEADRLRSEAPSPSPQRKLTDAPVDSTEQEATILSTEREVQPMASPEREVPMVSTELDDPFVDHAQSPMDASIHNLNGPESLVPSEWDEDFSDNQQAKFENRVPYFDGRVGDVVGNLLEHRLAPLEKALGSIQHDVASAMNRREPSTRRDRRSASAEPQHSDADDEDEEPVPRRSMSPRRDRRFEQMRAAVIEGLNTQKAPIFEPSPPPQAAAAEVPDQSEMMALLQDMRDQFGQSMRLDFRADDLHNAIEDAVERRIPTANVSADQEAQTKMAKMQAQIDDLEDRLRAEQAKTESEVTFRREAQDKTADLQRSLNEAGIAVETESQSKKDLASRLSHLEEESTAQSARRIAAEEKIADVKRLLRISTEEEARLREMLEDKEQKIKSAEETRVKTSMRVTLLEANQGNNKDLQSRLAAAEANLRAAHEEGQRWRSDAESIQEKLARQSDDLTHALSDSRALRSNVHALQVQVDEMGESRDMWSRKFAGIQNEMAATVKTATEEVQRMVKSEEGWMARREILEARLQAEAKTRERIEQELARLESLEKQGLRAMTENERLAILLSELRSENHKLQQTASRFQREFEEARDAGMREVQRTRISMQTQLDASNHEVNVVREEYEEQNSKLRTQLDQAKLDVDTAASRSEMLIEAAETSKKTEVDNVTRKHQDEMEDVVARFERQTGILKEDAQRSEQNYLERLSLSTSKNEHLQDRISHLTERLEISNAAAKAAADAAKVAVTSSPARSPIMKGFPATLAPPTSTPSADAERFSAKAFRETIDSLQGQLEVASQEKEELLTFKAKWEKETAQAQSLKKSLADAEDERQWLNELLDIREADMLDLCRTVKTREPAAAQDAIIRLEANIQMHLKGIKRARQSRSGSKGIAIPSLSSIRDAAPAAAVQAFAAFGNWSKSGGAQAARARVSHSPAPSQADSSSGFLPGLLTPPASGVRRASPAEGSQFGRPTAASNSSRRAEQMPALNLGTSPAKVAQPSTTRRPSTPPMMQTSSYDSDAQQEDFDDAGFFEEE